MTIEDILTGVEFETYVYDTSGFQLEPYTYTHGNQNIRDSVPNLDEVMGKWTIKPESPMGCEFTYANPEPFGDFLANMRDLFTMFEGFDKLGLNVQQTYYCGMHVHFNATEHCGPHVPSSRLIKAYFDNDREIQSSWWGTIADTDRDEDYECAERVYDPDDVCYDSKMSDITSNPLGTIEIRTWDATTNWDLIEKRYDLMRRYLERATA